jgi:hypothetical protein
MPLRSNVRSVGHRKHRFQQFICCCMFICCHWTGCLWPLPSNGSTRYNINSSLLFHNKRV